MQTPRPLRQPVPRLVARRIGKDGHLVHEALFEPDALSVLEVNRGNDQHVGKKKES
ncbi:MAG: hypothetical protein AW07_01438 [Candidatus Accumulibacter sp. SK-11]|nr:MAG: hypothetical protein AW07_01438 [Candidatus Accumulibacter sp. SK-11]